MLSRKDAKSDDKQDDEKSDKKEKKKRTLEETLEVNEETSNKKAKDAQKLGSKTLNVPVDECCYLSGNYSTAVSVYLRLDANGVGDRFRSVY